MLHDKTLLIANRGEIAVRIARAARDLGIKSVGIAPSDDQACLHLRHVDTASEIPGRGPAAYLDGDEIIKTAVAHGCDAVHPGYGFLSENADFARACEEAGILFVGPRPETLSMFGDKVSARDAAKRLAIPLPEGSKAGISLEEAQSFFENLGGHGAAMIKAVAGGGGRGMRVVRQRDELASAYQLCRAEAQSAFGRDAVYIERYVAKARHVEVQVLGDGAGQVIHFGDRECSLQRRHQKLIEIAPSPGLPAPLRHKIIDAALTMARDSHYRSLGTFEFLVDLAAGDEGAFYFMEANPRIQVEHTVTEEVAGIDLVDLQLQLIFGASFADLDLNQDQPPRLRGYAIQARINMETMLPDGSTTPGSGRLSAFDIPSGPGIRVDTLGYTGYQISPVYDSLLAKIIAVSKAPDFSSALARLRRALDETRIEGVDTNIDFLRNLLAQPEVASVDFHTQYVEQILPTLLAASPHENRYFAGAGDTGPGTQEHATPTIAVPEGHLGVIAPMPGTLSQISAKVGDEVFAGQQLALVEAMKMQMVVEADVAGTITAIHVADDSVVDTKTPLFILQPQGESAATVEETTELDLDTIRPELRELHERRDGLLDAARPDAVARRHKIGKRMVRENLAEFFDDTRYDEYGSLTFAAQRKRRSIEELIRISPADGLITATGSVNADLFGVERSRCMALAYDYTVFAGTQGFNGHHKQDRMLTVADKWSIPIMIWAEGGGGRPGDTDFDAVTGLASLSFARLAQLNGKVPMIAVVSGRCFAGNAAMAGCCDVVIATRDASLGMAGPAMIEGGGLGIVKPDDVGPMSVQAPNGVVDLVVENEAEAVFEARRYLGYFQGNLADWQVGDQRQLRFAVPENRMRAYDIRNLLGVLADVDSVMELRRDFASGMITALIRLEGRPIGVIANDSRVLGGAIDADCADKATRFMQLCDGFNIPILTLCDTPGFMVGPEAEKTALVRHVSRMFVTAASLSVPLVTVVLRKGYGLGAMAMAGGSMHAPIATLSWPTGEFGGMGLEGAVRLAYRSELEAAAEGPEREALFNKLLGPLYERGKALSVAAGLDVDDVIDPMDSRQRIVSAFATAGPLPLGSRGRRIDTW